MVPFGTLTFTSACRMGNQWGEDEDLMLGEMRRSQTFGEYTVIVSHVDRMMCFDQSSVIVWIDSVRHTHI